MTAPFPNFRELIVRPVLLGLGMHSPAAENLEVGTALVESDLGYLQQMGGGPALGLWQMEPATFDDHLRYLHSRLDLLDRVRPFAINWPPTADELPGNLYLGAAMCRIHYWRKTEKLPAADDLAGLAAYWKNHYNTKKGAGRITDFMMHGDRILEN